MNNLTNINNKSFISKIMPFIFYYLLLICSKLSHIVIAAMFILPIKLKKFF